MFQKRQIYAVGLGVLCCIVYVCMARVDKEDKQDFAEEIAQAYIDTSRAEFNIETKRQAVLSLIAKAQEYFEKNKLVVACNAFSQTDKFVSGDTYVSVMDMKGRYLVHPDKQHIWESFFNKKDSFGTFFAQDLIKKAQSGGGWVTYEWRGATKISFVKMVHNGGQQYILECSYYPHSKEDAVITLVKGAVAVINQDLHENRPVEQAFSTISYRMGRFVLGDLYLYAVRFDGVLFAQGEEPRLVGENVLSRADAEGRLVNKETIEKLQSVAPGEGVWVEYVSKRARKRAYAEKITDAQGTSYFIACGYYPNTGRKEAVDLVQRGYQYMKSHGLSQAVQAFGDVKSDFIIGDLALFVYNMQGIVVAPESEAGRDYSQRKDEDGKPIFAELLEISKDGGGWADFKMYKSFQSVYVEKVDLGVDTLLIGTFLYPVSKRETMLLLAKSGANYLQSHVMEDAFDAFSEANGSFIRGDLSIFVFDLNGTCYVYGDDADSIWKNFMDAKDDDGKQYVKLLINAARSGPAQVTYHLNGRPVIAHVETVEKDGTIYVVGSEFYQ